VQLRRATATVEEAPATYVGREKCIDCHQGAFEKWVGSDHDLAMDVATEETVLGDFDDAVFTMDGNESRFFRRDGKFFVYTEGPDGEMTDFEVTHVFGVRPLQQYLIPFPGGRYQVLSIAWDTEKNQWYDMYPEDDIAPGDWLHWTRQAQNWNSMCADCHSTNLVKGYDMAADSYATTWSEIDVSCETCHGPGSRHVAWAEIPAMGRPATEGFGLVVRTRDLTGEEEVDLCAPCHSRRYLLGPIDPNDRDLLDREVPALLREGLYHPDGQILDEVYVYASFVQSKMYRMGVRCSDCHDVHSLKRHKEDNDLCLQCHRAEAYNTPDHHFHTEVHEGKPSAGWLCVKCHMPEQPYMVVDWRADHSIRNPRPDLAAELGIPNACNDQPGCHGDQSVQWSLEAMQKWYGLRRRPHYGTTLAAGRGGDPYALDGLIDIAQDGLYPGVVRATAVDYLQGYAGEKATEALNRALGDQDALVRLTAIRTLNTIRHPGQGEMVAPLLYDPVKAVRIEAAMNLTDTYRDQLKPAEREVYETNLQAYREVMEYSGDFAFGRYNLGNLAMKLGERAEAEEHYEAATAIDDLFYPAKVNLAFLLNGQDRNEQAEALLRQVLEAYPQQYEVAYNLALLLGEIGKYEDAAVYFAQAADGMPGRPRIRYNLGLVLQHLGRLGEAERQLLLALQADPNHLDTLYALADHYLKRRKLQEARAVADRMIEAHPEAPIGHDLKKHLEQVTQ
jgi:tetratricopeptide (TPR) repeat protein